MDTIFLYPETFTLRGSYKIFCFQCVGNFGVCPDEKINFRNDASIINGERRDGFTSITYSRPFETGDRHDLKIRNGPQTIVAAIGSLDVHKMAKYHTQFHTKSEGDILKLLSLNSYLGRFMLTDY